MRTIVLAVLLLAACASAQRDGAGVPERAAYAGYDIEQVREAAVEVVRGVAHPNSEVRVTNQGRVVTDGPIGRCDEHVACATGTVYGGGGPSRTTIALEFSEEGADTIVEIDIDYEREECHREPGRGQVSVCETQTLGSTGGLEREVLEGIRVRLEAGGAEPGGR